VASDPGAVDAAILAALRADAALVNLLPGGLFYDVAPSGVESFGIVSRLTHADDLAVFASGPWDVAAEMYLYLVKAVVPGPSSSVARPAALRMRAVLDGNATLAVEGYALVTPVAEVIAIRETEVDETNPDRRVQHWGGRYEVHVQRTAVQPAG
jgi:hypothetical protein